MIRLALMTTLVLVVPAVASAQSRTPDGRYCSPGTADCVPDSDREPAAVIVEAPVPEGNDQTQLYAPRTGDAAWSEQTTTSAPWNAGYQHVRRRWPARGRPYLFMTPAVDNADVRDMESYERRMAQSGVRTLVTLDGYQF